MSEKLPLHAYEHGYCCYQTSVLRRQLQESERDKIRFEQACSHLEGLLDEALIRAENAETKLEEAEKLLHHGEGVCFKCQDNAVMYIPISSIAGYEQRTGGKACQTK